MSNGNMKLNQQNKWAGRITTRNIDFDFWLEMITNRKSEKAPVFDIMTKSKQGTPFRVGVVFEKRMKDKTDDLGNITTKGSVFYSMSIDDPSLPEPLYVTAFPAENPDDGFDIVWQRPRQRSEAA